MSEMQKVTVKGTAPKAKDGGYPLSIFDRDEAYEGGELYIADDKAHEVPLTTAVKLAINEGRLAETKETSVGESTGTTGTNVDVNALTNQPSATGEGTRRANSTVAAQTGTDAPFVNRDSDTAETLSDRYDRETLDKLALQGGVPEAEVKKAKTKGDVAELILAQE